MSRHYLMCRPTYFAVDYAINPWMDPTAPVDADLAIAQWEALVDTYRSLGHTVEFIDPIPGLPDMVFAANGATVVDGAVLGVSFTLRRARRRRPGLPRLVRPRRLPHPGGEGHQRGRGRHAAHRPIPAGRYRLPHRPRRPRRGAGAVRPPGDHAATRRPALLPPRHRADRAEPGRRTTAVRRSRTCRRRSPPAASGCSPSCSRTRSTPSIDDAVVLGLNAASDGTHVVLPVAGRRARRATSVDRGTSRCPSTCPSCSRPAAARSAAPWRYGHDHVVIEHRPHHAGARRGRGVDRAQLPPAAGRDRRRRRRLGHRRRRPPLPGLPGRLLGAELRPPAPGADRGRARAARPGHADQPRVRARPVRAVLPRAGRAVRHRPRAADEHRRRGRRDRDQGGPQVGLPGQGRAGRPGEDHRGGGQLPRPYHHDHQLLHRSGRARRLRPVHARASRSCPTATWTR